MGVTERFDAGANVTQGSVGGALISSNNLAVPTERVFNAVSNNEVVYGEQLMQPIIFQDDLARIADNVTSAQVGNDMIESIMETKILDLNEDKSCYIVFGEKQCKSIDETLNTRPLLLYGRPMVRKEKEVYLGEVLHCGGLAKSVRATVEARQGKIQSSIIETRVMIEDCRSNAVGGLAAGLDAWETAIIPSLLSNCQTWVNIDEGTMDILTDIQNSMYRTLLTVPKSTPPPSLAGDCGGLMMKYRIMKAKLIFIHHIINLSKGTLARDILDIQVSNGYPGLMLRFLS